MQDKDLNKFLSKNINLADANASVDEAWGKMNELLNKENEFVNKKKKFSKKIIFGLLFLIILIPTCYYFYNPSNQNILIVKKKVKADSTKSISSLLKKKDTNQTNADTILNNLISKDSNVTTYKKFFRNKKILSIYKINSIKNKSFKIERKTDSNDVVTSKNKTLLNEKIKSELTENYYTKIKNATSLKLKNEKTKLRLKFTKSNKFNIAKNLNLKSNKNINNVSYENRNSLLIKKELKKLYNDYVVAKDNSNLDEQRTIKQNLTSNKNDNTIIDTSSYTKKHEELKSLDKKEVSKKLNEDSSINASLINKLNEDTISKNKVEHKNFIKLPKKNLSKLSFGLNWQIPIPVKKGTFTNVYGNNSPFANFIPELFIGKSIGTKSSLIFTFNPYFEYTNNTLIINKEDYTYTAGRYIGSSTYPLIVDSLNYIKTLSLNKTIGVSGFIQYYRNINAKFSIAYGIGYVHQVYGIINNKLETDLDENLLDSTYSISSNNKLWENVNKSIFTNRLDFYYKINRNFQLGLSVLKPFSNLLKDDAQDKKPLNFKMTIKYNLNK